MKSILVLLVIAAVVSADMPFFAGHFGDHMVLQREPRRARVWGWIQPGQSIVCKIKDQTATSTADQGGRWVVNLPPIAAGGPYDLSCTSNGVTKTLRDVLFGDVYLCGGQSNMQMSVKGVNNAAALIAEANTLPNIRLFTVGQGTWSDTPLPNLATLVQPWSVASAASVGNDVWSYFSAVCYMAGRNIHVDVHSKTVPVGLISSNWGGTYLPAWVPREALSACPDYKPLDPPNKPAVLWNAMIQPLTGTQLSGVFWYQGESDVDIANGHKDGPAFYLCAFPQFIKFWRTSFGRDDLPFMFVQLAPYMNKANEKVGEMRISQEGALAVPMTCMASAVDQGDAGSPLNPIHPRNKDVVAARLTNCARKLVYRNETLEVVAPVGIRATQYGMNSSQVVVRFDKPIRMIDAPACPVDPSYCATWRYIGRGGTWKPISKAILVSKTDVLLYAPEKVEGVSYLMCDWPLPSVYSATSGLPATPFGLVVVT